METYNKRKAVKFETAKDFLTANRDFVFKTLKNEFYFNQIDFKEIVKDYFNFVTTSNYNNIFSQVIDKKSVKLHIEVSVSRFKREYKALGTNFDNLNKFNEERREAMLSSKSL